MECRLVPDLSSPQWDIKICLSRAHFWRDEKGAKSFQFEAILSSVWKRFFFPRGILYTSDYGKNEVMQLRERQHSWFCCLQSFPPHWWRDWCRWRKMTVVVVMSLFKALVLWLPVWTTGIGYLPLQPKVAGCCTVWNSLLSLHWRFQMQPTEDF